MLVTAAIRKKVAYPQVPHTTPVMCDGKAAFNSSPIKVCQPGERLTQPYKSGTVVTKVRILRRVGKVRRLIQKPKIPLVLIESMTATNIEQIDLT